MLVPTRPSHQACPEDDDFLAALDKMVNENIAESKNVVRDKNVMSSMTGPVSGAKGKKNWEQLQQESEASAMARMRLMARGKVSYDRLLYVQEVLTHLL